MGFPAGLPEFVDAEATASVIRLYENFVITSLFQVEEYARAVLRAGQRADKLERLVQACKERQEMLAREDTPHVVAVLDEYAIRRRFGDRDVMVKQLEHLLALAQEPNITLHVVPDRGEICPGGSFEILSFPNTPNVAYVESAGGCGQLIEHGEHVAELEVLFELIRGSALSAADSGQLIRGVLEDL